MKIGPPRRIGLVGLSLMALVVGIVTGAGAVFFRALIGLIHNIAFLGRFEIFYDASVFTPPSPWGAYVILVPVLGGVIVTFLVTNFAPEARGHGVPEVMDAIYYREGIIRPVVAVIKSLASALSIGTGAAVGREGPIIQIGASLGSSLGQVVPMLPWQRITLVAAGAGAGIAATFNTPIGGVMFAIELMMPELSARTFLPVALATGAATFIGRILLGLQPAFAVPDALMANRPATVAALLLFAVLGCLMGIAAAAFVRGLTLAENIFDRIGNSYLRHIVGMTIVGGMMYAFFVTARHYYVEGVGYATIQAILSGDIALPPVLAGAFALPVLFGVLYVGKLAATSISLGSGASGGIFSPSLFMGATLGGAFGALISTYHPVEGVGVATCAMIGMAAMVGGGTGAAMTAVTMIFEMTRDYDLVMPIIVAVALAIGVRRVLSNENIYTVKLVARGHFVPKALHANMFLVRHAGQVMAREALVLPADKGFDALLREAPHDGLLHVVVTRSDHVVGVIRVNTALRRGLADGFTGVSLGDVADRRFSIARESDVMFDVISRMTRRCADMVVVTKGRGRPRASDVVGVISKEDIADAVAESIKPYGEG
jgi:chloride channel protein, CIC family